MKISYKSTKAKIKECRTLKDLLIFLV